jgi:hypothetical protein
VLEVVGGLVAVVAALLALDWLMAGRRSRRVLKSARDEEAGNLNAGYALIEREGMDLQQKSDPGGGI